MACLIVLALWNYTLGLGEKGGQEQQEDDILRISSKSNTSAILQSQAQILVETEFS